MGFSSQPDPESGLTPLSQERIQLALDFRGWNYQLDDEGDIVAAWEDGFFYFLLSGESKEILYIRGTWFVNLTTDEIPLAQQTCQDWNQNTLWPKAYTSTSDTGVVRVCCEHAVDWEHGLTNKQLGQQMLCTVNTGMSFFEKLNEVFPTQTAAQQSQRDR